MIMRDTVFCLVDAPAPGDRSAIVGSIEQMIAEVSRYVPGYRLKQAVQITAVDEPAAHPRRRPAGDPPGQRPARGRRRRPLPARLRGQPRHHDVGGAARRRADRGAHPSQEMTDELDEQARRCSFRTSPSATACTPSGTASGPSRPRGSPPPSTRPAWTRSRSPTATAWPAPASSTGRAATAARSGSRPSRPTLTRARLTTLLLPGIGTITDLKHAFSLGVRSVRVATHCTEADVAAQHIAAARELGHGRLRVPDDEPHGPAGRPGAAGGADGVLRRALRLRDRFRRPPDG